jgi:hypothetical protein
MCSGKPLLKRNNCSYLYLEMKNQIRSLTLITMLLLYSCDDKITDPIASCQLKTKTIKPSGSVSSTVTYDYQESSVSKKITLKDSTGAVVSFEEYQLENGKPLKATFGIGTTMISRTYFEYSDNQLVKTKEYGIAGSGDEILIYTRSFTFENSKLKRSDYQFANGNSFYDIYTFSGDNIETIKAYKSGTNELTEIDTFVYDDKKNPNYNPHTSKVGLPLTTSKNNVIHYQITSYSHQPSIPEADYIYEYNETGYPTSMKFKVPDGRIIFQEQYSYTCTL